MVVSSFISVLMDRCSRTFSVCTVNGTDTLRYQVAVYCDSVLSHIVGLPGSSRNRNIFNNNCKRQWKTVRCFCFFYVAQLLQDGVQMWAASSCKRDQSSTHAPLRDTGKTTNWKHKKNKKSERTYSRTGNASTNTYRQFDARRHPVATNLILHQFPTCSSGRYELSAELNRFRLLCKNDTLALLFS